MFAFLPFSFDKMNTVADAIMKLTGCAEQADFCGKSTGLGSARCGFESQLCCLSRVA